MARKLVTLVIDTEIDVTLDEAVLKDGEAVALTTDVGLFNDVIYLILEDDQERFWMSCNKGIFRVDKADLEAVDVNRQVGDVLDVGIEPNAKR